MKWKKSDKQIVIDKLTFWKRRLGLTNWTVVLDFTGENEEETLEAAKVEFASRYRHATIYVRPCALTGTLSIDEIICHELVHCLIGPLIELLHSAADGCLITKDTIEYFNEAVTVDVTNAVQNG